MKLATVYCTFAAVGWTNGSSLLSNIWNDMSEYPKLYFGLEDDHPSDELANAVETRGNYNDVPPPSVQEIAPTLAEREKTSSTLDDTRVILKSLEESLKEYILRSAEETLLGMEEIVYGGEMKKLSDDLEKFFTPIPKMTRIMNYITGSQWVAPPSLSAPTFITSMNQLSVDCEALMPSVIARRKALEQKIPLNKATILENIGRLQENARKLRDIVAQMKEAKISLTWYQGKILSLARWVLKKKFIAQVDRDVPDLIEMLSHC